MPRIPLTVPVFCYPKKDPEHPCPCQDKLVDLTFKTPLLFWKTVPGARVQRGQVLAEFESEKKTMELLAPADGVLTTCCVAEGEAFAQGTVLGYLEDAGNG